MSMMLISLSVNECLFWKSSGLEGVDGDGKERVEKAAGSYGSTSVVTWCVCRK